MTRTTLQPIGVITLRTHVFRLAGSPTPQDLGWLYGNDQLVSQLLKPRGSHPRRWRFLLPHLFLTDVSKTLSRTQIQRQWIRRGKGFA